MEHKTYQVRYRAVTTIDASSTIYTAGNIQATGMFLAGDKVYVHRNIFAGSALPSISLAIGDTDTGFNWYLDGAVQIILTGLL